MRPILTSSMPVVFVAVTVVVSGCGVQQDHYDDLLQAKRSMEEQNVRLADENDALSTVEGTHSEEVARWQSRARSMEQQNQQLRDEMNRLTGDYDHLLGRVSTLEIGPLPPDVASAIEDLVRAYPQLLAFDAQQGMVRFASDFSFPLGLAELQPEAAATIGSLADILTSPAASDLEVTVIGHTDNVPIGKPETRQKHPTNRHLSVHRAISVGQALQAAGVEPARVLVAGYGEYRPVAANSTRGAAPNRRVEIYLRPMSAATAAAIVNPVSSMTPAPERAVQVSPEPSK